jgi:hypothetical protein
MTSITSIAIKNYFILTKEQYFVYSKYKKLNFFFIVDTMIFSL